MQRHPVHIWQALRTTGVAVLVVVVVLAAAACSSDDDDATPTTPTSSTTTTAVPDDPLLVQTEAGPVRGGPSAVDGVRAFLGIPYAEAPVGDLAWRPPQPRAAWTEPLDATEPGPACPQTTEGVTAEFVVTPDPDPDCLDLSVWTPADATSSAAPLPVMVWIHGGSLETGSAHQPLYTGDDLAAEGVVVVGNNYRLGPQGFLVTDQLRAETDDGAVGNYGFMDQQLALKWVQDNVAAFGGDPDDVTIFGESAGGFSVCGHLAASRDLFDKAIIQSGGGCARLTPVDAALAAGEEFMAALGCTDLDCLRSATTEELLAVDGFSPSLVADGVTLAESALDQARAGALDDVPVLLGSNANEATLFTLGMDEPSDAELVDMVSQFTDRPDAVLDLYPAGEFASNTERFRAMFTDAVFACPTVAFARVAPRAYLYHYTFVSDDDPFGLGATHGAELASLFDHPEGLALDIQPTDETRQLSDDIQRAWTTFAATGDPGEGFAPYADAGTITVIDVPFSQVDEIRGGRCGSLIDLLTPTP